MASEERGWGTWLKEKRHEIPRLRLRDALLGKAVADIHRHCLQTVDELVPLQRIQPIHAIDRPGAIATLAKRIATLRHNLADLGPEPSLNDATLRALLPSVSGFHGVRRGSSVITFEGNGRLAALKEVLGQRSKVAIAVTIHEVDEPGKIARRVQRVRRLNALR
jgi:hypothetical protein